MSVMSLGTFLIMCNFFSVCNLVQPVGEKVRCVFFGIFFLRFFVFSFVNTEYIYSMNDTIALLRSLAKSELLLGEFSKFRYL